MKRFVMLSGRLGLVVRTGSLRRVGKPRAHAVVLKRRYGTWRRRFVRVIPVTREHALILERKRETQRIGIRAGIVTLLGKLATGG